MSALTCGGKLTLAAVSNATTLSSITSCPRCLQSHRSAPTRDLRAPPACAAESPLLRLRMFAARKVAIGPVLTRPTLFDDPALAEEVWGEGGGGG